MIWGGLSIWIFHCQEKIYSNSSTNHMMMMMIIRLMYATHRKPLQSKTKGKDRNYKRKGPQPHQPPRKGNHNKQNIKNHKNKVKANAIRNSNNSNSDK